MYSQKKKMVPTLNNVHLRNELFLINVTDPFRNNN